MRRFRRTWLVTASLFFVSGVSFLYFRSSYEWQVVLATPTKKSVVENVADVLQVKKHVTKSLAELGRTPELSDHILFFNRVPKTGSEMIVLLLQWLQGANNFKHMRLKDGNKRKLKRIEQEELVHEITSIVRDKAVPLSFDRHVYFINFTSFDRQSPTFINIIRDPVEKFISRFYYKRVTSNPRNPDLNNAPKKDFDEKLSRENLEDCVRNNLPQCTFKDGRLYDFTIPYFCGQDERCMMFNNEWALATAKSNVERYYAVVGVLEEMNATLEVAEHKLNYFFRNVQQVYFKGLFQPHFNKDKKRPNVSNDIVKHLRSVFVCEYEFYEFVRQRLFQQLQMLYGHSH